MGVSGCGKSTTAGVLAGRLGWDLAEGDDLHPRANIDKMAHGIALTDDDRRPWLQLIADWIGEHTRAGRPGVVTCSALRRRYRDVLRGDAEQAAHVVFVHLAGTKDEIAARLAARHGHFMPPALLDSQFEALEEPDPDEHALRIGIDHSPAEQAERIIASLELHPGK
ncbi:MAG: gluconokinase [Jatrophihabitans sp.]|uniref:gluconokinase n=1 Tax=Jatrophihabitans sp. TaxID=1932789 RepID=UPI003F7ED5CE